MSKLWLSLIFIIAVVLALPVLLHAVITLIPTVLVGAGLVGIGALLFRRRRYW